MNCLVNLDSFHEIQKIWGGVLKNDVEKSEETLHKATSSNIVPYYTNVEINNIDKIESDEVQFYDFNTKNYNLLEENDTLTKEDDWNFDSRWGTLPDDLIDRILAWLPLPSFFAFQSVCKRWNDILYSPSFYQLCSLVPQTIPWFIISAYENCKTSATYDPLTNRWYMFKFPTKICCGGNNHTNDLSHPIAAADGLLCSSIFQDGSEYLLICNPMTRACTMPLSIPVNCDNVLAGMIVDKKLKKYQVVLAECISFPRTYTEVSSISSSSSTDTELEESECFEVRTFVYDSQKPSTWKHGATFVMEGHLDSGSAMCKNLLYFITHGAYKPSGLIAYDVNFDSWRRVNVTMPRLLLYAYLIDHHGDLLMIGGLGKFCVTTKIWIWKLDTSQDDWILIGKLPPKLFKEFFSMSPSKYFMCTGQGNLLYLCTYKNPRCLVYNIYQKCWDFLPPCPLIAKYPSITPSGFCFEPRLDGSVLGRFQPDPKSICIKNSKQIYVK